MSSQDQTRKLDETTVMRRFLKAVAWKWVFAHIVTSLITGFAIGFMLNDIMDCLKVSVAVIGTFVVVVLLLIFIEVALSNAA